MDITATQHNAHNRARFNRRQETPVAVQCVQRYQFRRCPRRRRTVAPGVRAPPQPAQRYGMQRLARQVLPGMRPLRAALADSSASIRMSMSCILDPRERRTCREHPGAILFPPEKPAQACAFEASVSPCRQRHAHARRRNRRCSADMSRCRDSPAMNQGAARRTSPRRARKPNAGVRVAGRHLRDQSTSLSKTRTGARLQRQRWRTFPASARVPKEERSQEVVQIPVPGTAPEPWQKDRRAAAARDCSHCSSEHDRQAEEAAGAAGAMPLRTPAQRQPGSCRHGRCWIA
jgi:hypothetical protein